MTTNTKSRGYQISESYRTEKQTMARKEQERSLRNLERAVRDLNKGKSRWGVVR